MVAWLSWISWSLRRMALASRPDPLGRAWLAIEKVLGPRGGTRAPHEGVLAYCERLMLEDAELATVMPLARRYALLRYGPPAGESERREFIVQAREYCRHSRRRDRYSANP
jgi:hypothetical protein